MKVRNYSRHELNQDQILALAGLGLECDSNPLNIVFISCSEVYDAIQAGAALVAPLDLVLDALKLEPTGTLVCWQNHPRARARGRFALAGTKVYHIVRGVIKTSDHRSCQPSVEQDLTTGDLFPFKLGDPWK